MSQFIEEFVCTLLFVYVILATGNALAIGAALALVIFLTKGRGHFNPAVTVTLAAAGKYPVNSVLPQVAVQVAAGLAAMELFRRYKF